MDSFSKKIDDINFAFKNVLEGAESWYHVTYTINERTTTLRMHKNEKGIWKIAEQALPEKIQYMEMKFANAIDNNEENSLPQNNR